MLDLNTDSIPLKEETFEYVSYSDVLQAELDCMEAQQTLTDFINFNEILLSIRKNSSSERVAFASDLLGVDVASLEAMATSSTKSKSRFASIIEDAWTKLHELIKTFFKWICKIINGIVDAIKKAIRKARGKKDEDEPKKEEDQSDNKTKNNNDFFRGNDDWDPFRGFGGKGNSDRDPFGDFGGRRTSSSSGSGPNNNNPNHDKTNDRPREDKSNSSNNKKYSISAAYLTFGDSVTKLCAKSENLGTVNTDTDVKVIDAKIKKFTEAIDNYSSSGKEYSDLAFINKYCLMIKKTYNNIYIASENINRLWDKIRTSAYSSGGANSSEFALLDAFKAVNRTLNGANSKIMGFIRKDVNSIRTFARSFLLSDWNKHMKANELANDVGEYTESKNKDISNFNINK